MLSVQNIIVLRSEAGLRLSQYFKRNFPEIPHTMIEKWCRKGSVRLNGKRVKASTLIDHDQVIRVPPYRDFKPLSKKHPYVISNDDKKFIQSMILYQDNHIIVLNKPEGLAVQGGTGTYRHVDGLLNFFVDENKGKPHLVHRLDRDTSGVLVIAKTPQDADWLMRAFKDKLIKKTYWALIMGRPEPSERLIDLPLEKCKFGDKEKMEVIPSGKSAMTHLKVLDYAHYNGNISWVELKPETGRTHQLRVHCQAIKHPILGDHKYGGIQAQPFDKKVKMHLHAHSISIPYSNGQVKTFEAPLPQHMLSSFQRLGFDNS